MNMQALLIRANVFVVLCLAVAVAAIQREPATAKIAQTPSAHIFMVPATPPWIDIVVLPTVTIRPTAGDMAIAAREVVVSAPSANSGDDNPVIYAAAAPALPNLRMDMPYFSFSKVLPRVGKE